GPRPPREPAVLRGTPGRGPSCPAPPRHVRRSSRDALARRPERLSTAGPAAAAFRRKEPCGTLTEGRRRARTARRGRRPVEAGSRLPLAGPPDGGAAARDRGCPNPRGSPEPNLGEVAALEAVFPASSPGACPERDSGRREPRRA